ncbi:hypothetical protein JQ615_38335 [Bradyrhizobium jicamae]|uniref:Uncharacterized protein n=1 Tax=Bradyrhizobium jicamae TaxID=280332 RepID=A0ABS5FWJ0_9BRAD|nr:hypothetical protein [Bradyrhizobium jicamae]MBR0801228.1 hypothetical protein [Bradyrhizobium jicamae]
MVGRNVLSWHDQPSGDATDGLRLIVVEDDRILVEPFDDRLVHRILDALLQGGPLKLQLLPEELEAVAAAFLLPGFVDVLLQALQAVLDRFRAADGGLVVVFLRGGIHRRLGRRGQATRFAYSALEPTAIVREREKVARRPAEILRPVRVNG